MYLGAIADVEGNKDYELSITGPRAIIDAAFKNVDFEVGIDRQATPEEFDARSHEFWKRRLGGREGHAKARPTNHRPLIPKSTAISHSQGLGRSLSTADRRRWDVLVCVVSRSRSSERPDLFCAAPSVDVLGHGRARRRGRRHLLIAGKPDGACREGGHRGRDNSRSRDIQWLAFPLGPFCSVVSRQRLCQHRYGLRHGGSQHPLESLSGMGETPRLQAKPSGGLRYDGRPCANCVEPPTPCIVCTTISCSPRSIASRCGGGDRPERAGSDPGNLSK